MIEKQNIKPKNLLEDNNLKISPFDPIIIAEKIGITVSVSDFKFPLSDIYSSFFDFNKKTIFINKNTPFIHITFSIAYELEFYLFFFKNKEDINHRDMLLLLDSLFKGFFQTTQQKELLNFIANLLVPKHILSQYKYFANQEKLSKLFSVPKFLIEYQE